jgi:hypothetical protein
MQTIQQHPAKGQIQVLENLLLDLQFEQARALFEQTHTPEMIFRDLKKMTKTAVGTLAYTFAAHAAERTNSSVWHQIAAKLAIDVLTEMPNARKSGLEHLLKAIETDEYDVELKQYALSFSQEGLLPRRYIRAFAEAVLKVDPANHLAIRAIEPDLV